MKLFGVKNCWNCWVKMMKDREKELKKLIYIKSKLINQCKKEIKTYQEEIDMLNGYKQLERTKTCVKDKK